MSNKIINLLPDLDNRLFHAPNFVLFLWINLIFYIHLFGYLVPCKRPHVAKIKIYYEICQELVNLRAILTAQRTDWWVLVKDLEALSVLGKGFKRKFCGLTETNSNNSSNNRDSSSAYCVPGTKLSAQHFSSFHFYHNSMSLALLTSPLLRL